MTSASLIDERLDRLLELAQSVASHGVPNVHKEGAMALDTCCESLERVLLRATRNDVPAAKPEAASSGATEWVESNGGRPITSPSPAAALPSTTVPPPSVDARAALGGSPFAVGSNSAAGADDRVQQHLVFLVHGIGQNDDFKDDDQLVSWDGVCNVSA